jgi:uncharacterized protein (DUF362 family)
MIYYGVLFIAAVSCAYCLRLGTMLAIFFAAALTSLVGQYAGGTLAQIWTFLPLATTAPPTFPPTFLIVGLWPLEFIVEFALSAMLADGLIWFFQVRPRQKIEDGKKPVPHSTDEFIPKDQRIDIDFYEKQTAPGALIPFLVQYGRRSMLKTVRINPETGELITAVFGLLLIFLGVFEKTLCPSSPLIAATLSALFLVALMIAPKLFWKRLLGLTVIGSISGYTLFSGIQLALFGNMADAYYFGKLTTGALAGILFLTIYGTAYLVSKKYAFLTAPKSTYLNFGEPKNTIAISSIVVSSILLALVVLGPHLTHLFTGSYAVAPNPALLLFVSSALVAFVGWWFFTQIPISRSLIQTFVAFTLAGLFFFILFNDPANLSNRQLGVMLLLFTGSAVVTYLFAFTASAHLAAECLSKGFFPTYTRQPKVDNPNTFKAVFHDRPHPDGLRREKSEGAHHRYPPKSSGVNVSIALTDPSGRRQSIQKTLHNSLDGLVGSWPAPDGKGEVTSFADAIKGKKVFVKPNLVVPCGSPYTTSPELLAALAEYCLDHGAAKVVVGEIAISNITSRMSMEATGLVEYLKNVDPDRIDVLLLDEDPFRWLHLSDAPANKVKGVVFDRFHMPTALLEEETFYIDVPKLKTHLQASVTLGIKNSHGMVPEIDRGRYHQRISQKVLDITKVWNPDLTIVDGYDGLEGIGPWPGDLVELGAIISSNDVALADLVSSQLMQKEEFAPSFERPVDFKTKFVKAHWLGFEQGLGILSPDKIVRTINSGSPPVDDQKWQTFLERHSIDFRRPEYRDEALIKNIGARVNRHPNFNKDIHEYNCETGQWDNWDSNREYLPLDRRDPVVPTQGPVEPLSNWGPAKLIADEWRYPDLGASVMFSGVFGLMKTLLEGYFTRELNILDGFVIVYGPLRKPLECEGAILFGDDAIATDYLLFAPRVYPLAGHGKPPNCYSDVFERLAEEMGGKLVGFTTEALTFSRGWYW